MCECRVFGSFASDLQQAKVTTVPNGLVHVESISTEYFMRPCTGGDSALHCRELANECKNFIVGVLFLFVNK